MSSGERRAEAQGGEQSGKKRDSRESKSGETFSRQNYLSRENVHALKSDSRKQRQLSFSSEEGGQDEEERDPMSDAREARHEVVAMNDSATIIKDLDLDESQKVDSSEQKSPDDRKRKPTHREKNVAATRIQAQARRRLAVGKCERVREYQSSASRPCPALSSSGCGA